MNEEQIREIEQRLKSVSSPPAPSGLRQKILEGAAIRRTERRIFNPILRTFFVMSVILFVFALTADVILSHREAVQAHARLLLQQLAFPTEDAAIYSEIHPLYPNAKMLEKHLIPRPFRPRRQSRNSADLNRILQIEEEIDGLEN